MGISTIVDEANPAILTFEILIEGYACLDPDGLALYGLPMIDLHTHSTASDGTLTPGDLVHHAHSLGVNILALTDHDTIEGLQEAEQTAINLGIQFIPGIELDISYFPGTFHLLGLGIDYQNRELLDLLNEFQQERERRNKKILKKMNAFGISCTWKEMLAESSRGVMGRPHFARILVKKGWARDISDAFDRFLGFGKPLYEGRVGADLEKSIQAIHTSGGLAFIAHPLSLRLNWGPFRIALQDWMNKGIDGIETYHSGMSYRDGQKFAKIAKDYNLLETGGSDFHSPQDRERKLGRTCIEGRKIPDSLLIPLMDRFGRNRAHG